MEKDINKYLESLAKDSTALGRIFIDLSDLSLQEEIKRLAKGNIVSCVLEAETVFCDNIEIVKRELADCEKEYEVNKAYGIMNESNVLIPRERRFIV